MEQVDLLIFLDSFPILGANVDVLVRKAAAKCRCVVLTLILICAVTLKYLSSYGLMIITYKKYAQSTAHVLWSTYVYVTHEVCV